MSDKIFEDDELYTERFACNCLAQEHSLDVSVELADKGTRLVECSLTLYMAGEPSLKWRLRQSWKCLRGQDGELADFYLRQEDIPNFIGVLRRAIIQPPSGTADIVT